MTHDEIKEYSVKKKFFTDQRIAGIIRWWAIGAVYFFVGWGTGLGAHTTAIDFAFFLILAIGIFEMFVVNPIIFSMFKVKNPISLSNKDIWYKVRYRLTYFFKVGLIVLLVIMTYNIINIAGIKLLGLGQDQVLLPGEPILFGAFYMVYYYLIHGFLANIKKKLEETE